MYWFVDHWMFDPLPFALFLLATVHVLSVRFQSTTCYYPWGSSNISLLCIPSCCNTEYICLYWHINKEKRKQKNMCSEKKTLFIFKKEINISKPFVNWFNHHIPTHNVCLYNLLNIHSIVSDRCSPFSNISFSRLLLYFRSSNVSFTTVCALPRNYLILSVFFSSSDINIDFCADVFSVTVLK